MTLYVCPRRIKLAVMPFFPLIVFQFHSFYVLCLVSRFTGRFEHPKGSWKKQEYLCVQHFLSSQSEWAGYCQRGIFLPLIPIRHVPSRSKGCLSDTQGHTEEEKAWEKTKISTGQSASPSWDRLPSPSPTTQPSQWWGTSMKYLAALRGNSKQNLSYFSHLRLSPPFVYTGRPFSKLVWLEGGQD